MVGETDRKMLKAAIKYSAGEDQVRHRVVSLDAVTKYAEKLESLKDEIAEIMQEEKEEKLVRGNFSPRFHINQLLATPSRDGTEEGSKSPPA